MTVEINAIVSGPFYGNGVTTKFPRNFSINNASDVVVEVDGIIQLQGYTVLTTDQTTGDVEFDVPPVFGEVIYLTRQTPLSQNTDYSSQGTVSPEQIERDIDYRTRIEQELKRDISRSVKVPLGQTGGNLTRGNANQVLKFDANGNIVAGATDSQIAAAEDYTLQSKYFALMAQEWADNTYNDPITSKPKSFSARHHAIHSGKKAKKSYDWSLRARDWAIKEEDTYVEGSGGDYSAKHYAIKAKKYAANTNVADKADKTYVDMELAKKVNSTSFRYATTSKSGITEQATNAEAAAGTDTVRYITPKHLNNLTSSLLQREKIFTQSGTFTIPAGVTKLRIDVNGAGGGGGSGASTAIHAGLGGMSTVSAGLGKFVLVGLGGAYGRNVAGQGQSTAANLINGHKHAGGSADDPNGEMEDIKSIPGGGAPGGMASYSYYQTQQYAIPFKGVNGNPGGRAIAVVNVQAGQSLTIRIGAGGSGVTGVGGNSLNGTSAAGASGFVIINW